MKKHISLLSLYARSSLLRVLLLLLIMVGAELWRFMGEVERMPDDVHALAGESIEQLFIDSRIPLIFGAFFLLLTVLLCLPGCSFGSKTAYTFDRLSVSEKSIFWWQVAYNAAIYMIFWGVQTGTALLCCQIYCLGAPSSAVSAQTVFLAFNCSSFLRSLLPLRDFMLWGRNFLLVFALALSTARFPVNRRRGKFAASVIFMVPAAFFFCEPLGDYTMSSIMVTLTVCVIGGVLWAVYTKEEEDEIT